ncbi:MAG: M20/M25/M40 family metallo-hydrolase [Conexivisphaera sp.]
MSIENREEIKFLMDLVNIYSPSGREARIARYLYERLTSDFSFDDVKLDDVGNVIATYRGKRPSVLLCGHMDTVPGRLPVRIEDGYLLGRGSVDAKGSLAAMVLAAHALKESGYEGEIVLAAVVDEEGRGSGAKHLARSGLSVDYVLLGEPSGIHQITVGYKGRIQLRVNVETEGFHASSPWLGKSAFSHSLEIIGKMRDYVSKEGGESPFDSLTLCVTMMQAGVATNVAPPNCSFTLDIRVPPRLRSYKVVNDLLSLVKEYVESTEHGVDVQVVPEEITEAFLVDKSNPLVSALSAAIRKITGRSAQLVRKTGTGDMNILGFSLSVPAATYGPGDPKLSHTNHERLDLNEYLLSVDVLKESLRLLYSRHNRQP